MKKQQKIRLRRLLGVLTALLVAAGIAVGVYWVGSLRGWFAPPPVTVETSSGQTVQIPPLSLTAKSITGKALVERGGLSFAMEEGEILRAEDAVTLQGKGTLTVSNETLTLTFGNKATFLVGQKDSGEAQVTLNQGVLYAQPQGTAYFVVGNQSAQVTDGTVSLSVGKKAFVFDQLSGSASFLGGDESVLPVSAQQRLTVQQAEGRWGAPKQKKLTLKQLSDFTLELAKDTQGLCFTPEQLTGEIARREAEAQQKLEEQLRKETEQQEAEAKAKADAEAAEQAKAEQEKKDQEAKQKAAEEKKAQEAKRKAEEEKQKKQEAERKKQEEEKKRQEEEERKQQEADNTTSTGSCTLTIQCHTLLDNLDNVKESKKKYVPSSGVILKKTKVTFTEGETVYDILKRTCKTAGIQLEVSYSGGYGSYYVEGIGHLYEFDCGRESGWVYSVNGRQPNYGCSSCVVQEGDNIVWSYTCSGMGKDV